MPDLVEVWYTTTGQIVVIPVQNAAKEVARAVAFAGVSMPLASHAAAMGAGRYSRPRPARVGSAVRSEMTVDTRGGIALPAPVPTNDTVVVACATFFPVTGSSWFVWSWDTRSPAGKMASVAADQNDVIDVTNWPCTAVRFCALFEWTDAFHTSPPGFGPDMTCRK